MTTCYGLDCNNAGCNTASTFWESVINWDAKMFAYVCVDQMGFLAIGQLELHKGEYRI